MKYYLKNESELKDLITVQVVKETWVEQIVKDANSLLRIRENVRKYQELSVKWFNWRPCCLAYYICAQSVKLSTKFGMWNRRNWLC